MFEPAVPIVTVVSNLLGTAFGYMATQMHLRRLNRSQFDGTVEPKRRNAVVEGINLAGL